MFSVTKKSVELVNREFKVNGKVSDRDRGWLTVVVSVRVKLPFSVRERECSPVKISLKLRDISSPTEKLETEFTKSPKFKFNPSSKLTDKLFVV